MESLLSHLIVGGIALLGLLSWRMWRSSRIRKRRIRRKRRQQRPTATDVLLHHRPDAKKLRAGGSSRKDEVSEEANSVLRRYRWD